MEQKRVFLAGEGDAYFQRNTHTPRPDVLGFFARHIRPGQRVLEIGCASGHNVQWLAEHTGCQGFGVDPSSAAINAGRRPGLQLEVGTADAVPFAEPFDMVIYGFCLYLVDRPLLHRTVAEGDRLVKEGGQLGIWDFDVDAPAKRAYHHVPGMWSYKMDYSRLWLADPAYSLIDKMPVPHEGNHPDTRIGLWLLRKLDGYQHDHAV